MRIGYARVSTEEQNLALQRQALKDAGCERLYEDKGVSGATIDRPALKRALKAAKPGDVVVVWKLDRLGRDLRHLVNLAHLLTEKRIGFKVLEGQGAEIDTTTANGRLIFGIFAALAEFERELISERTRAGMAAAKRAGKHVGRPRKLTDEQVAEARQLIEAGTETRATIAARYGIRESGQRRRAQTTQPRLALVHSGLQRRPSRKWRSTAVHWHGVRWLYDAPGKTRMGTAMANKLAGQRAKFSRARAIFYSTGDDGQRRRAAELMAEVLAEAPANGFSEDAVTQGEDVPDDVRQLAAGMPARPADEQEDPDELVAALQTTVDTTEALEIGEGNESVYAYGYRCAPDRLKIGSCSGDAVARIAAQIGTGTPDKPVLLLQIRTHDCRALERTLHGMFRLKGRQIAGAGAEWFLATREEAVAAYERAIASPWRACSGIRKPRAKDRSRQAETRRPVRRSAGAGGKPGFGSREPGPAPAGRAKIAEHRDRK